jgi:hypothetical protein
LFKSFLETAVRTGIIDPKGKSNAQIQSEFDRWVRSWPQDVDLRLIVDHRAALVASARLAARKGDVHIASVLYAVWTEHWLNGVIKARAAAVGLNHDMSKEMIRSVQVAGKTTWLLFLLGLPRISSRHATQIHKLFEARNSFIHYKWTVLPDSDEKRAEEKLNSLVLAYDRTVEYLQRFENKYLFSKTKRRLHRIAHVRAVAVQHGVAPGDRSPAAPARR